MIRVLFVSGGAFVIGASAVVAVWYWRQWVGGLRGRLLPLHVATVATCLSILMFLVVQRQVELIEDGAPYTYQTVLAGLAIVLGIVAMEAIVRVRLRKRKEDRDEDEDARKER